MFRVSHSFLTVILVVAAAPLQAQTWWAWNRHEVLPVAPGVWEVVSEVGSGAQDYWCAIGDFSIRQLRSKATQRIYVWREIGPSVHRAGRKAVHFALSPPDGADTSHHYSLSVKFPGRNINAATARNYCFDRREDFLFRRW